MDLALEQFTIQDVECDCTYQRSLIALVRRMAGSCIFAQDDRVKLAWRLKRPLLYAGESQQGLLFTEKFKSFYASGLN